MSNDINNNSNWIDVLKHKTEQATRPVPQGIWEAISNKLPSERPVAYKQQPRLRPMWWKAMAAAAAIAIAATTGFIFIQEEENLSQPSQLTKKVEKRPMIASVTPADSLAADSTRATATPPKPALAPGAALAKNSTPSAPKATTTAAPKPSTTSKGSKPTNAAPATTGRDSYDNGNLAQEQQFDPDEYFYDIETMQALEELYADYDNVMNQEAMEPWKTYSDTTYQQHLAYDANARKVAREKMALSKKKKHPSVLLAAHGTGLISSDHNSTVNSSSASMMLPKPSQGMMMAPAAPGTTSNVAPPVNYKYHHHMPLTAGLTFNKRITRNLYGSLGLNFTSMSSDVTPDNGAEPFKQNINLIGLPFGVKWNFWKYRGLTTFIGAEGLMEKVVWAKFNGESVTIKRLQWSIHATAGIQYNFTQHLGIYLAPKLSHYITTMPLSTLRSEHPLNFNLQLGLSLDF